MCEISSSVEMRAGECCWEGDNKSDNFPVDEGEEEEEEVYSDVYLHVS